MGGVIAEILFGKLDVKRLKIENESHKHAGHFSGNGDTHFKLEVVSADFSGESRVQRHRLINTMLSDCFDQGLHALSLSLLTPDEEKSRNSGS